MREVANQELRKQAYSKGMGVGEIAKLLNIDKANTIYGWIKDLPKHQPKVFKKLGEGKISSPPILARELSADQVADGIERLVQRLTAVKAEFELYKVDSEAQIKCLRAKLNRKIALDIDAESDLQSRQ